MLRLREAQGDTRMGPLVNRFDYGLLLSALPRPPLGERDEGGGNPLGEQVGLRPPPLSIKAPVRMPKGVPRGQASSAQNLWERADVAREEGSGRPLFARSDRQPTGL